MKIAGKKMTVVNFDFLLLLRKKNSIFSLSVPGFQRVGPDGKLVRPVRKWTKGTFSTESTRPKRVRNYYGRSMYTDVIAIQKIF